MKQIKEKLSMAAVCALEIIVGVLLLIEPVGFTSTIFVVCGFILVALGALEIGKYFHMAPEAAAQSQLLTKGLVMLLCGGFCVLNYEWFIVTFPLLTMVYGVVVLVTGLGKIEWTVDLIRMKRGKWQFSALSAALSILCAVIIIRNPFTSTAALWIFTGSIMIVESIMDIISLILSGKKAGKSAKMEEITE